MMMIQPGNMSTGAGHSSYFKRVIKKLSRRQKFSGVKTCSALSHSSWWSIPPPPLASGISREEGWRRPGSGWWSRGEGRWEKDNADAQLLYPLRLLKAGFVVVSRNWEGQADSGQDLRRAAHPGELEDHQVWPDTQQPAAGKAPLYLEGLVYILYTRASIGHRHFSLLFTSLALKLNNYYYLTWQNNLLSSIGISRPYGRGRKGGHNF